MQLIAQADKDVKKVCTTAALLLLYYCFTTALLLLSYCGTTLLQYQGARYLVDGAGWQRCHEGMYFFIEGFFYMYSRLYSWLCIYMFT
jgi:hypothetical protein